MAEHADGSIIVDTEIDPQGFKAGSSELQRAIKSLDGKLQSLGPTFQKALSGNSTALSTFDAKASSLERTISEIETKMRSLGQIPVPTDDYKWLTTEIQKAENELDKLIEKQIKMEDTGVGTNSRAWQSLQYDIDLAKRKISEYKAEQAGMRANGTAFKTGESTIQYKELEAALASAKNKLAQMRTEATDTGNTLDKSGKKGKTAFSKLGATLKKSTSKLRQFTKQSNRASYSMNSFGGRIRMMIMMLKQMLVMRAFMGIMTSIGDGLKNLSQYSKRTNTYLSVLKSGLTQLKNSFATAFAPILTVVTPVLQTLINYLATAITYVGKFVAALTGAKTFTKATAVQEDFAASLDTTRAAAEKAQKQLAGFDELNVLSDTSSAGGGASGTVSPSEMFEEVPIDSEILDFTSRLKEAFLTGDWKSIGALFGEKVGSLFGNVDLSGIGATVGKIFKAAFDSREGFLSALPEDLRNILMLVETIGLGFASWKISNVLLSAINNLVGLPSVVSVGVALAITGLTIGAKGIADSIQVGLNGFNFAEIIGGSLLGTGSAALLGSSLATWITTTFEGSAIATAISTAMTNLGVGTAGAVGAALGAGFMGIIAGIPAYFVGIYDACKNGIDWLSTLLINVGVVAAGAGIGAIIGALGGPIGAGVGALIGLAVGIATSFGIWLWQAYDTVKEWANKLPQPFQNLVKTFGSIAAAISSIILLFVAPVIGLPATIVLAIKGIGEAVEQIKGFIKDLPNLPDKITEKFSEIEKWFDELPTKVSDKLDEMKKSLDELPNKIKNWFTNTKKKIKTWFSDLWQPIKDYDWSNLGQNIGEWFGNAVKNAYTIVTENIPAWWEDVKTSVKDGFEKLFTETLPKFFNETLPQVVQDTADFFEDFPEKLSAVITSVKDGIKDVGSEILNGIFEGLNTIGTAITDFADGFVQGFKDAFGIHGPSTVFAKIGRYLIEGLFLGINEIDIAGKLSSITTTISTPFTNLKDDAFTWGKDLCDNMANGISKAKSTVESAVKGVASKIKSFLGFSEPEAGPLSNFHTYMPDMIDLMTYGIKRNQGKVINTVSDMASAISNEIQNGDYVMGNIKLGKNTNSVLTGFSDKVANSFSTLLDRLQAIADGVTFTMPAMATGTVVPYSVSASTAGGNNVTGAIEASNDELGSVIIQAVTNATTAIVVAIEENCGSVVSVDADSIATSTIKEINRRTRAMGKSPLVTT